MVRTIEIILIGKALVHNDLQGKDYLIDAEMTFSVTEDRELVLIEVKSVKKEE